MALIILNSKVFSSATISGLKLFFYSVMPGLLPFMFLTKLLTEMGFLTKISNKIEKPSRFLFGTPGITFYALTMSILSGYPIGAKIISDLYQKKLINEKDAKKMSVFCTTSGPIFIIGAVGIGMLSSFKLGLIIYISHVVSSIILGIVINLITREKSIQKTKQPNFERHENIFSYCVGETINSIVVVCAYITIFYLITEIFITLNIIPSIAKFLSSFSTKFTKNELEAILYGIVEVTRGCKSLSVLPNPPIQIICGLISFSGISIIMQSMSFLKTAKIKTHTFLFYKCVHSIVSILICKLLLIIYC